jgi:hypothetical protein
MVVAVAQNERVSNRWKSSFVVKKVPIAEL